MLLVERTSMIIQFILLNPLRTNTYTRPNASSDADQNCACILGRLPGSVAAGLVLADYPGETSQAKLPSRGDAPIAPAYFRLVVRRNKHIHTTQGINTRISKVRAVSSANQSVSRSVGQESASDRGLRVRYQAMQTQTERVQSSWSRKADPSSYGSSAQTLSQAGRRDAVL